MKKQFLHQQHKINQKTHKVRKPLSEMTDADWAVIQCSCKGENVFVYDETSPDLLIHCSVCGRYLGRSIAPDRGELIIEWEVQDA